MIKGLSETSNPIAMPLQRVRQPLPVARSVLFWVSRSLGPLARVGAAAALVIGLGQLGRAGGSWLASAGYRLPARERLACVLAYVPKATIQAAFAGVALDVGAPGGELILSAGVLAIALAAPIGVVALHRGAAPLLGPPDAQRAPARSPGPPAPPAIV